MTEEDSREIVIERVFDAPRDLVWKMWTDPEHVAAWWGPHGMKTRVDELDLRPGGKWRYVMLAPDGSEYPQGGTFSEVVPPEKLVMSAAFEYGGGASYEAILTYEFEDLGDKTKLIMRSTYLSDFGPREGVIAGWNSNFDSLVAYLPSVVS
jgi:uncharacterized protein YndB with AHSA1/START domain